MYIICIALHTGMRVQWTW